MIMLADAPRYVKKRAQPQLTPEQEMQMLASMLNQSTLR